MSGGIEDLEGDLPDRREPSDAVIRILKIVNKKGMHARAAAKFMQAVERFDAQVQVTRGGETVDGSSILDLLMLAAGQGTSITVEATGKEASAVADELEKLVSSGFGEEG
jgi:phosphocarrier protein